MAWQVEQNIKNAVNDMRLAATQIDEMIIDTQDSGWSTNLVTPLREVARNLRKQAIYLERTLNYV